LKVISAEIQSGTAYFREKDGQGHLVKAQYGSWIWQALQLLAKGKRLRGTALDIFGNTAERRMVR
jgi:indolepyruvate ferredoxin oxidoreductase